LLDKASKITGVGFPSACERAAIVSETGRQSCLHIITSRRGSLSLAICLLKRK